MKISGFTIIKNAVINNYPIIEAIRSVLPVVDEMIVLIGDCSDNTPQLIAGIEDKKIKIFSSVWNPALKKGGAVLAEETNKAFQLISPESTWAFYIQGDEVIHEKDYAAIREACEKYKDDKRVEGLLFRYIHFYATYDYYGDSRKWYSHEVRIVRNDKQIHAYRDAQGFRKGRKKLWVKPVDADIYHYGWVKSPKQMLQKQIEVSRYWNEENKSSLPPEAEFDFSRFDTLKKFTGTHPAVMKERIAQQNWQLDLDISQKHFSLKDGLLYYFEKLTGIRPFDFRNYKILRH